MNLIAYRCPECNRLRPEHEAHDLYTTTSAKTCASHGRDRLPICVPVRLIPEDEARVCTSCGDELGQECGSCVAAVTES